MLDEWEQLDMGCRQLAEMTGDCPVSPQPLGMNFLFSFVVSREKFYTVKDAIFTVILGGRYH